MTPAVPLRADSMTASRRTTAEVTSWTGVEAGSGRRGEFAFSVGRREIGHLRGDRAAHFNFPKALWAELIKEGRIQPHPMFTDAQGPADAASRARTTSAR